MGVVAGAKLHPVFADLGKPVWGEGLMQAQPTKDIGVGGDERFAHVEPGKRGFFEHRHPVSGAGEL